MFEEDDGFLIPQQWLRDHPELKSRGIKLELPLKPVSETSSWRLSLQSLIECRQFCAWRTVDDGLKPQYAVKLVPPDSEEADIYEQLHQLGSTTPNHTLPCEVIHAKQPFLIMPCLVTVLDEPTCRRWGLLSLLDFFRQVIEVSGAYAHILHSYQMLTRHAAKGIELLHELHIAHLVSG